MFILESWPTPTPIPTSPPVAPVLDMGPFARETGEAIVSGWQFLVVHQVAGWIIGLILLVIVIAGTISIMQHIKTASNE